MGNNIFIIFPLQRKLYTRPRFQVQNKMNPNENHQGSRNNPRLEGIIPRIERQTRHEEFVNACPTADPVMLPINHAARLLRKGITAETYTDAEIITTTTIHDDDLKDFNWATERAIVEAFGPAYHIPTDYWVYGNMDKEDRLQNVQHLMKGTEWMVKQLAETQTQVIPLVKGYSKEERAVCYHTFDKLDINYICFYGSQYFGGKNGNGINDLNSDLRDITSEYSPAGILLIGLQSSNYLSRLPPEVVAAAGQRWIKKSGLRDFHINEVRRKFSAWKHETEQQLGTGIATLGSFSSATEVTA